MITFFCFLLVFLFGIALGIAAALLFFRSENKTADSGPTLSTRQGGSLPAHLITEASETAQQERMREEALKRRLDYPQLTNPHDPTDIVL